MDIIDDKTNAGAGELIIRIPKTGFGEFIASLLGQKRSISRRFLDRKFIATREWVINIIDIVEQRLNQNTHELISFEASIYFRNGTTPLVKSIEAFRTFSDFSNEESAGVYIKMSYLVYFPSATGPEKQDIKIRIFSDCRVFYEAIAEGAESEASRRRPMIDFDIEFTDLTFGEDISRHLATYIESICRPKSLLMRLLKFISARQFMAIAGIPALMITSLFLYTTQRKNSQLVEDISNSYKYLKGDDPFSMIESKVDAIFNLSSILYNQRVSTDAMPVILTMTGFLILAFVNVFLSDYIKGFVTKSFVIFNKHTAQLSETHSKRMDFIKWTVYIGGLVGIGASLIASGIFKLIFE
jgi:hypothetical protein